jgi:hypothetical protein
MLRALDARCLHVTFDVWFERADFEVCEYLRAKRTLASEDRFYVRRQLRIFIVFWILAGKTPTVPVAIQSLKTTKDAELVMCPDLP